MVDNMAELVYRKMGAKIRYYRQVKGINQTDFAIKVSISSQYLSKIENGKRIPSLEYRRGLGGGGSGAVGR